MRKHVRILRAFNCRLIINSGQTVHNFKVLDVLEAFLEIALLWTVLVK